MVVKERNGCGAIIYHNSFRILDSLINRVIVYYIIAAVAAKSHSMLYEYSSLAV